MGLFKDKKYKLIRGGKQNPRDCNDDYFKRRVYRLQALRDIPERGVKAGDLGGLVTSKKALSHEGSCWIGYDAEAFGNIYVYGNAYIGDNASLRTDWETHSIQVYDNACVAGNTIVEMLNSKSIPASNSPLFIRGNAHVYGNAWIQNVKVISGNSKIYDDAKLRGVKEVSDEAEIFGETFLDMDTVVIGTSKIHGNARIEEKSTIRNADISGDVVVPKYYTVGERVVTEHSQLGLSTVIYEDIEAKKLTSRKFRLLSIYNEISGKIASYETDIVKIIKYPTMTDRSDVATLEMSMALTAVDRLVQDEECDDQELAEAIKELEIKFMVAESNALKLAATKLSETEIKKIEKAKDLLAIAADEASSENEKKQSFKQAFKQLEGVIVVPEVAVDTFRIKVGLQEIEA